jgi:hypothetical protein
VKDWATVESFEDRMVAMEEVVELRRMFGNATTSSLCGVSDLESYDRWLTTQLVVLLELQG